MIDRKLLIRYSVGDSPSPPEEYWADALSIDDSDEKIEAYIEKQRGIYQKAWLEYVDEDNW